MTFLPTRSLLALFVEHRSVRPCSYGVCPFAAVVRAFDRYQAGLVARLAGLRLRVAERRILLALTSGSQRTFDRLARDPAFG